MSAAPSRECEVLSGFSHLDEGSEVNDFGMLAFHVNTKTFGACKQQDTPDNGLGFQRVRVDVLA